MEQLQIIQNTNPQDGYKENYNGKTIALVAHRAPQLALDVITKNITWEQAIEQDWRKTKNWQLG